MVETFSSWAMVAEKSRREAYGLVRRVWDTAAMDYLMKATFNYEAKKEPYLSAGAILRTMDG